MFTLVINTPIRKATIPFFHIWEITYVTLNGVSYLNYVFFQHYSISKSVIIVNFSRVFADYIFF